MPTPADLEKMLRVRLRGQLKDEALDGIALQAIGSSGADIERIVKDPGAILRVLIRVKPILDDVWPHIEERYRAIQAERQATSLIGAGV